MEGHGNSLTEKAEGLSTCEVAKSFIIFQHLSQRQRGVIRKTKLKDIQAWRGESLKGTVTSGPTQTASLSVRGLRRASRAQIHACACTYACGAIVQTLKCKEAIKGPQQCRESTTSNCRTLILLIRTIWLTHA